MGWGWEGRPGIIDKLTSNITGSWRAVSANSGSVLFGKGGVQISSFKVASAWIWRIPVEDSSMQGLTCPDRLLKRC